MRVQKLTAAKLLLIVFFLFAVFFPLSHMFTYMAGTDVLSVHFVYLGFCGILVFI